MESKQTKTLEGGIDSENIVNMDINGNIISQPMSQHTLSPSTRSNPLETRKNTSSFIGEHELSTSINTYMKNKNVAQ